MVMLDHSKGLANHNNGPASDSRYLVDISVSNRVLTLVVTSNSRKYGRN
jgi:hypothetical protein